jgi:predicted enzyme related to lactoylglutathione lyase
MAHRPGTFGWIDLSTSDVAAAKAFYSGLLGWEMTDVPTDMGVDYTMCTKDGRQVAGLGPQPPELAAAGVPSMWNAYVIVDSVDDAVSKATRAGGSVAMPAMDVMDQGRMAMITDPSGGTFGVWQAREHHGAELTKAPGSLIWTELQTRDLSAALAFYAATFGWVWRDTDGYRIALLNEDADPAKDGIAGAMTMPTEVPPMVPANWQIYLGVEDVEAAAAKAIELGGSIFLPTMNMDGMTFAGITDPTGAMHLVGDF